MQIFSGLCTVMCDVWPDIPIISASGSESVGASDRIWSLQQLAQVRGHLFVRLELLFVKRYLNIWAEDKASDKMSNILSSELHDTRLSHSQHCLALSSPYCQYFALITTQDTNYNHFIQTKHILYLTIWGAPGPKWYKCFSNYSVSFLTSLIKTPPPPAPLSWLWSRFWKTNNTGHRQMIQKWSSIFFNGDVILDFLKHWRQK